MKSLRGIVRIALGLLLVIAGVLKAGSGEAMAETIANYRLLSAPAAQILAVTLPWIEMVAGLLLVLGLWTRAAAGLSAGMLGAFGVAVLSALLRGLDISCGCFGSSTAARVGFGALGIDVLGVAGAVFLTRTAPVEDQDSVR
jgi:uncharacterized membrane protein YphA (DoxX/SURF4 family)